MRSGEYPQLLSLAFGCPAGNESEPRLSVYHLLASTVHEFGGVTRGMTLIQPDVFLAANAA
jgi:hypothetical protein